MSHHDEYFGFNLHDQDTYHDCITEFDGEDLPDEIEALLEIEADFNQGR
jgi:hypothetical protein